jgi:hypothetical protein
LTGLTISEATSLIKQIIKLTKKNLKEGSIKPNVGDGKHHILKIIWGNAGIDSGFGRLRILNELKVQTKMKENIIYILLKKE